ncbi:MAG: RNA 2',3'-cyclic phosphodiesterase [Planctomycetes bacterium]|nr:RNA 2',3'-cyclic phosphodiesterase [Planctomycetota bacterium]
MASFYHAAVRCFVALDLPAPVRNHLAKVADRIGKKGNVKWVPPDQMHLTLVFAGDLDPAAVDGLRAVVGEVEVPALSLSLSGLGHFPPRGEPRVVWAGVAGDVDAVAALHDRLETGVERLGVPREKRDFVPHVTLGRVRSSFGAFALVKQLGEVGKELNGKPFVPTGLVLYRSELLPSGPIHTPMLRRPVPPAAPSS